MTKDKRDALKVSAQLMKDYANCSCGYGRFDICKECMERERQHLELTNYAYNRKLQDNQDNQQW